MVTNTELSIVVKCGSSLLMRSKWGEGCANLWKRCQALYSHLPSVNYWASERGRCFGAATRRRVIEAARTRCQALYSHLPSVKHWASESCRCFGAATRRRVIEAAGSQIARTQAAGFPTWQDGVLWQSRHRVEPIAAAKMERVALPPGQRLVPGGRKGSGVNGTELRHV